MFDLYRTNALGVEMLDIVFVYKLTFSYLAVIMLITMSVQGSK